MSNVFDFPPQPKANQAHGPPRSRNSRSRSVETTITFAAPLIQRRRVASSRFLMRTEGPILVFFALSFRPHRATHHWVANRF